MPAGVKKSGTVLLGLVKVASAIHAGVKTSEKTNIVLVLFLPGVLLMNSKTVLACLNPAEIQSRVLCVLVILRTFALSVRILLHRRPGNRSQILLWRKEHITVSSNRLGLMPISLLEDDLHKSGRDQAHQVSSLVHHRVSRVAVLGCPVEGANLTNHLNSDYVVCHDVLRADKLSFHGSFIPEQGDVFETKGSLVKRPVEDVANCVRDNNAKDHGDEQVDRLCGLQHYHCQRISQSRVPSEHRGSPHDHVRLRLLQPRPYLTDKASVELSERAADDDSRQEET